LGRPAGPALPAAFGIVLPEAVLFCLMGNDAKGRATDMQTTQ
jgi:hypothetical protein